MAFSQFTPVTSLLTLGLLLLVAQGQALSFGDKCGLTVSTFCSKDAGLICGPEYTCICSHGEIAAGMQYDLVWVAEEGKCLAQPNSPCIGTKGYPTPEGQEFALCSPGQACKAQIGFPPGVGKCKPELRLTTFDAPCNVTTFCDKDAGLICTEELKCGCSHGMITEEVNYNLVWNEEEGQCVGEEGSACNVNAEELNVVAACGPELSCRQHEELPPTVGICAYGNGDGGNGSGHAIGLNLFLLLAICSVSILLTMLN